MDTAVCQQMPVRRDRSQTKCARICHRRANEAKRMCPNLPKPTQQPAGMGTQSGGNPQYSPLLARAAVAAGVDGLFLECHPEPKKAKSDAATMLGLEEVEPLLSQCKQIADLRMAWKTG